jgi:hypothetical protein
MLVPSSVEAETLTTDHWEFVHTLQHNSCTVSPEEELDSGRGLDFQNLKYAVYTPTRK